MTAVLAREAAPLERAGVKAKPGMRARKMVAACAVAVASMGAFALPASAHTWNQISSSTSCNYYSYGKVCTTTKLFFKHHSGFCQEGGGNHWSTFWYCYAQTTSSTFN
ncbi:MAG: hypothetical protein AAFN30_04170 [Actinomycetota bacterium]